MNNENPETHVGVQAEDEKIKTAKPLEKSYRYLQSDDCRLSPEPLYPPVLYSPLVLGLKACYYLLLEFKVEVMATWICFCIDLV